MSGSTRGLETRSGLSVAVVLLLLTTATASAAPSPPTHEAVCGLRSLFIAELSYYQEKDRYASPEKVGFLPVPCPDGTRPPATGPGSVGGCRFVFTVVETSSREGALKAEALGVGAGVEGLHFLVDRSGVVTRAPSGQPVPVPDCEAWRKEADPLWRYHDAVSEHDCVAGPYAPKHPCSAALAELAALARAGVGVAQKEYAAHPTARELFPLEPPSPSMKLCGLLATPEQRAQAAQGLEREGALLEAVLAPSCHAEGLRAALPRLFQRFDAVCPGAHCLTLLELAWSVRMPGRAELLKAHASDVAKWLQAQPPKERRRLLSEVVGLSPSDADALAQALEGRWPGVPAMAKLPREPLVVALLERGRAEHPSLTPMLDVLAESQGQSPASDASFRAWAESVPCRQFADVFELSVSATRLREFVRAEQRCPGAVVPVLQRHVAKLPPAEMMDVLEPLPAEKLRWMIKSMGLDDPDRAAALVDWLIRRDPSLLDVVNANAAVVRRLLAPENAKRLGGRDAVLAYLLKMRMRGTWHGTLTEDGLSLVLEEALKGQPPLDRVRHVASLYLPDEEKLRVLAGVLQARDPRIRAAAAAGMADWEGATIPRDAARACLSEIRVQHRCIGRRSEPLGPPPPGKRTGFPFPHRAPPSVPPSAQDVLNDYCDRVEQATRECQTACGGFLPSDKDLARLEAAAGESLPRPDAVRACEYSRP